MVTGALVVVQTYYVPAGKHTPRGHFEVHMASAPTAPTHFVMRTENHQVYQDALDAEGTDARFLATWHADGKHRCLDTLEPVR